MRYILSIIIISCFLVPIKAQESFLYKNLDTIKATTRTGGNLDSIDLINSEKFISTPGSFVTHPFGKFGNDYQSFFSMLTKQHRDIQILPFYYTALPHLGTSYAFGSKGTQYLVVNYNQSFSSKIHFTFSYKRNVAIGAYRNNAFSNDVFSIGILQKGNKIRNLIAASTYKQQRNLNGGISSFEEILNYGLEFAKVKKQNSSDSITIIELKTESEFGIFKKDSNNIFSIILNNKIQIDKRIFKEKDSLKLWYPKKILIDTITTRDLTQLSRLDNQFGIRYKKEKLFLSFLVNNGYWRYKSYAVQIKNELDLISNLLYKGKKWNIFSENKWNIIGAGNQTSFALKMSKENDKNIFTLQLNQTNLLPTPIQRQYVTNTLSYNISQLELQHSQTTKIEFKTKSKQSILFSGFFGNFQNQYYFIGDKWRNDTLNSISQFTTEFKGNFEYGILHFQPNISINLVDKLQLLPKYDLRARIFLAKKFKTSETFLNIGVDINYKSKYKLMSFDDRISLYHINLYNTFFVDYLNLDAFVSMQKDEFRMYFKIENLDSYWNNQQNSIATNYPIIPLIMRLGITWDFFN